MPLRRLDDEAVLRWHACLHPVHRRQGSRPGSGPARHTRRVAGDHPGQPRHLPNDAEFRSAFEACIEWGSRLAVENSQADAKPPGHMPMPRWDWHTAAGPSGSRVSALAHAAREEAQPVVLPAADEIVRFEQHVKPMFRPQDRQSMRFAFDLWSCDDVSAHADVILSRLRAGTMPCDGPWPSTQADVFQRWTETGKHR